MSWPCLHFRAAFRPPRNKEYKPSDSAAFARPRPGGPIFRRGIYWPNIPTWPPSTKSKITVRTRSILGDGFWRNSACRVPAFGQEIMPPYPRLPCTRTSETRWSHSVAEWEIGSRPRLKRKSEWLVFAMVARPSNHRTRFSSDRSPPARGRRRSGLRHFSIGAAPTSRSWAALLQSA